MIDIQHATTGVHKIDAHKEDEQKREGKKMIVTQETYAKVIREAGRDERLSIADFKFLIMLVQWLDENRQTECHLPQRTLTELFNLSTGAVGHAQETLIASGYLEGELVRKEIGRASWRLWLSPRFTKPGAVTSYEVRGTVITVTIVDKEG